MLGADDEDDELEDQEGSDDGKSSHPSLEEPLFDTDAEFSEEEKNKLMRGLKLLKGGIVAGISWVARKLFVCFYY